MHEGTVKWFSDDKGYGFIEESGAPDRFVHYSKIKQDGNDRRSLEPGQRVRFDVEAGKKGPMAVDVEVIS